MIGVGRRIVIRLVAAKTRIRRIVVIAIMTRRTIILNGNVSALYLPKLIVNWERRRLPIRCGCVAHIAIRWNCQRYVIWI